MRRIPRFYMKPSVNDPQNSWNIYDRAKSHPTNRTGHACVEVDLSYDEAIQRLKELNRRGRF